MRKSLLILLSLLLCLLGYLSLAPTPVEPVAWHAPDAPAMSGKLQPNTALQQCKLIPLPEKLHGPESIAIDNSGVAYISTHAGKILRWEPSHSPMAWTQLDSHPLGMEFDATGKLIIADAEAGLLQLTSEGTATVLSSGHQSKAFGFADDVAIASDGDIYFSDATTRQWPASVRNNLMKFSTFEMLENQPTGRLYRYRPTDNSTQLVLDKLHFANGVALSANEDFVLVNETARYRIKRLWLKGDKAGQTDIFIDNLPGFPDNITEAADGGFWLALVKPRNPAADMLSSSPALRKALTRLPFALFPMEPDYSHVIKLSETGEIQRSLQDPEASIPEVTSAVEHNGKLFLGSLSARYFGVCELSRLQ